MKSFTLRPDTVTHTELQFNSFRYFLAKGGVKLVTTVSLPGNGDDATQATKVQAAKGQAAKGQAAAKGAKGLSGRQTTARTNQDKSTDSKTVRNREGVE